MCRPLIILPLLFFILTGCSSENDHGNRKILIDDAHVLSGHQRLMSSYTEYNEQLFKDFRLDFRVITTESEEDINTFANRSFTLFEQESGSDKGRGLLLVINTRQDLARLEVSMALEPIYTDGFVSFIEHQHMVRFFRDNRVAEGIFATTEMMYGRAREAAAGKEFMVDMPTRSMGGGAKVEAEIGQKELNATSRQDTPASPDDTPEDVLQKYIQARRAHNNNPNLDIFTDETKRFFNKWTVTPVQMDNEVQAFSSCYGAQTFISGGYDFAVILYPIRQRNCSPYFFKKEAGCWKMDFATMSKTIRFNHENKWHLALGWHENMGNQKFARLSQNDLLPARTKRLLAPYLFAFEGLTFDANGYGFER